MIKEIRKSLDAVRAKYDRQNLVTLLSGIVVLLFLFNLPYLNILIPHRLLLVLSIAWLFFVYREYKAYFFLIFFTIAFILTLLGMTNGAEEMGDIIFFILLYVCVKNCISFFKAEDKND